MLVKKNLFNNAFKGRKVLVTGHTGFKGSWLVTWLQILGADVLGFSYGHPGNTKHFQLVKPGVANIIGDILDSDALRKVVHEFQPELVFHLAAQSLVRKSYREPISTYQTNVIGTLNVYEACRECPGLRGIVSITSDKVYENKETFKPYKENDSLGGHDMYSSSKACVELMTSSYRNSFLAKSGSDSMTLITARAGNVIGGGDYAEDRIVPDVMRAIARSENVEIRNPSAVRPWQHVLEPLSGYLLLGQSILESNPFQHASWNFGPAASEHLTVGELVTEIKKVIPNLNFRLKLSDNLLHEAGLLTVDSTRAHDFLKWRPVWNAHKAIYITAKWYLNYLENGKVDTLANIHQYIEDASEQKAVWVA